MTVKIREETQMMLICIKLRNEIETIFYYISKYASENLDLSNRKGEVCEFYLHLKSEGYDFSEIIDILSGHYEVEVTPEENLLNWYESLNDSEIADGVRLGVKETLRILGIKVEGINNNG